MAHHPMEWFAVRRRSFLAAVAGLALLAGALPALRWQLTRGDPVAQLEVSQAPPTTIDPAAVGVRRLDIELDTEDQELGAVGFSTGSVAIVVTPRLSLLVVDFDADSVGIVDTTPLGELRESLDFVGRAVAIAVTTEGTFQIAANGVVSELGLEPPPPGPGGGRAEARCEDPCSEYIVRQTSGGSWTAEFGAPVALDFGSPVVSPDGTRLAAWVVDDSGRRLEIADAHDTQVVPFSNEGSGPPALTGWTDRGNAIVYARKGASSVSVFAPEMRATGTVWLDEPVVGAALLANG